MTQAFEGDAPSWRVTSQQQTVEPVAGGVLERGVNVTWVMGGTTTGTVFVPAADAANIDLVKAAVQKAVNEAWARHQLSGTAGE